MRLAAEFEAAEGRDLRGLLDFLAARADADADAQAATAVEGHDGVRIMTIHSAKGLEFDVVAIPHLSRGLLPAARTPLLTLGREPEAPRVGMQLRRLGARGINLYAQRELSEDAQRREAEEELRLFHVGATRARERLLLSGVVSPSPPSRQSHGKAVIERIVAGFEIDRERDSTVAVPAPEPRPGLEATFEPSEIAVRVNLASVERAASLTAVRREPDAGAGRRRGAGAAGRAEDPPGRRGGRSPTRRSPPTARAPRNGSSTATGRFASKAATSRPRPTEARRAAGPSTRCSSGARPTGGRRPAPELVRRIPTSAEVGAELRPRPRRRCWPRSRPGSTPSFFAERVRDAESSRAEVPLLVEVAGTVLRGSIDLLVEEDGEPPLIVDYKTDRVDGAEPAELAARYEIQQAIYALAVAEARGVEEVELAYVFLERPEEPVVASWGRDEIEAGRRKLEAEIARVRAELIRLRQARPRWRASSPARRACSSLRPSPTASSSAAQ